MTQRKLHSTDFQIQLKSGLAANINTDVTKNLAIEGEPHWTTDTDRLYIFNGNENIRVHGLDNALTYEGDVITKGGDIVWLN